MNVRNRSTIRAIRGPVTLITLGALFAINNFTPYGFDQTWPVLLIVFGLLSLIGRGMERNAPPSFPGVAPGFPPPPPPVYPPPAGGGYRQTTYSQTNDPRSNPDPRNNPGGSV